MKSIDDLLREDAERWVGEQEVPVRKSGQAIMSKIAGRSRLYWISALGAITLTTIAMGVFQHNQMPTVVVQSAPYVKESSQRRSVVPLETHAIIASGSRQNPIAANTQGLVDSNLKALGRASSFEREVERISRKAAEARATDPLAAMLQYDGLARLCESHEEYAMAVTAWGNAVELAVLVGDKSHLQRMQRSLESVRNR